MSAKNSVEGWHNWFQNTTGFNHPTVYKLIEALRKEQSLTEVTLQRKAVGENRPATSKSKFVQLSPFQDTGTKIRRKRFDTNCKVLLTVLHFK